MRLLGFFSFFLFFSIQALPKKSTPYSGIKEGDIIFQTLPCGGLCDAIIATTPCQNSRSFNHCGIIQKIKDSLFVIEAIGTTVQKNTLSHFLQRDTTDKKIHLARIISNRIDTKKVIKKATAYLSTPYDNIFLPNDSAIYCSELIYDCFEKKNTHKKIFSLQPMTFKPNGSKDFHPAWMAYYKELKQEIPEGVLGINPCAIANSNQLHYFEIKKIW